VGFQSSSPASGPCAPIVDFRQQFTAGDTEPPFLTISAANMLEGAAPPQLEGKAVLIGFGASDLSDRLPTPVSTKRP